MTVLIATGASEGIALAADGFSFRELGGWKTDTAQKVWHGQTHDGRSVVFGWCGMTSLERHFDEFSFSDVSEQILAKMTLEEYSDSPSNFIADFARSIQFALQRLLDTSDPRLSRVSIDGEIAALALGWFANEKPICAGVAFSNENGTIVADQTFLHSEGDDFLSILSGSPTLFERETREISTLQDAIEVARDYTQRCVDNQDVIPDCAGFAGHVHVAALTRFGFSWVIPPVGL